MLKTITGRIAEIIRKLKKASMIGPVPILVLKPFLIYMHLKTSQMRIIHYGIKFFGIREEMRPSSVKPDKYPFEITPEEIDLRSDVSIQGIKGVCVRIKEKKTYNGSDKLPTIEDPLFYASYFPDEYTEVIIHAPPAKWNESEFKSLLRSLEITPPEGYY